MKMMIKTTYQPALNILKLHLQAKMAVEMVKTVLGFSVVILK